MTGDTEVGQGARPSYCTKKQIQTTILVVKSWGTADCVSFSAAACEHYRLEPTSTDGSFWGEAPESVSYKSASGNFHPKTRFHNSGLEGSRTLSGL